MSKQKSDDSADPLKITIYKITNKLKDKLGIRKPSDQPGELDPYDIEQADELIKVLCTECPQAIGRHLEDIIGNWKIMRDLPQSKDRDEITKKIFTLAHEIKDIGSLCGYDLAAHFAESLRDYIALTDMNMKSQQIIIQAHVDALTVVHKQGIKDDGGPAAEELKRMVKIAIDKYS